MVGIFAFIVCQVCDSDGVFPRRRIKEVTDPVEGERRRRIYRVSDPVKGERRRRIDRVTDPVKVEMRRRIDRVTDPVKKTTEWTGRWGG
jgi:hypothetical protein